MSWVAVVPDPDTSGFIGSVCRMSFTMKKLPMERFAAVMFVSLMPPAMFFAIDCAIEVRGVTWMPLAVPPLAIAGITAVITSPEDMLIVTPVASST